MFFTLFGCLGGGVSQGVWGTTCLCSLPASAAQKWSSLSPLRGALPKAIEFVLVLWSNDVWHEAQRMDSTPLLRQARVAGARGLCGKSLIPNAAKGKRVALLCVSVQSALVNAESILEELQRGNQNRVPSPFFPVPLTITSCPIGLLRHGGRLHRVVCASCSAGSSPLCSGHWPRRATRPCATALVTAPVPVFVLVAMCLWSFINCTIRPRCLCHVL